MPNRFRNRNVAGGNTTFSIQQETGIGGGGVSHTPSAAQVGPLTYAAQSAVPGTKYVMSQDCVGSKSFIHPFRWVAPLMGDLMAMSVYANMGNSNLGTPVTFQSYLNAHPTNACVTLPLQLSNFSTFDPVAFNPGDQIEVWFSGVANISSPFIAQVWLTLRMDIH